MDQERVIAMLAGKQEFTSGEEMSRALGVTRAAVWKEIAALREQGWPIESAARQGYRLSGPPPILSGAYISGLLPVGSFFSGQVQVEKKVDSTNTRLKAMAAQGAPAGTVLLAEEQTGGRGTRGRSFQSPKGAGLYLSVLFRPKVDLPQLFTLTGWAAVAVRRGIEEACGASCQIKWLNDIYLGGRKLVGILTEIAFMGESAEPDYVVVGVGVNVSQTHQEFQDQGLGSIAASLGAEGWSVERNHLAVCILRELDQMHLAFPQNLEEYLSEYRKNCLTMGRRVSFEEEGKALHGTAVSIDHDFALLVDGDDGRSHRVFSGTVTME